MRARRTGGQGEGSGFVEQLEPRALMSGGPSVTVNPGELYAVDPATHYASLTIDGGTAYIPNNAAQTTVIDSLNIINGGQFILDNNAMIINDPSPGALGSWDGSEYTGITGYVEFGAIESFASAPGYTSVGVAELVDHSGVLVKYTASGDATVDGKLNIDDYERIDSGIVGGATGWSNGDFNYDGKINIDDYTLIDGAIAIQSPGQFTAASSANSRSAATSLADVTPSPRIFDSTQSDDGSSGDRIDQLV
jgi:hypothetical protein